MYGFDSVTLSDANARGLDRCLDRAVYRIACVCDKDSVSSLHKLLGLQDSLVLLYIFLPVFCLHVLFFSFAVESSPVGCLLANKIYIIKMLDWHMSTGESDRD